MAFSNNHRVSCRQVRRLLMLDSFGISSLLLPHFLAVHAGRDGVFSILAGMGLAWLFIFLLDKIMHRAQEDYLTTLKLAVGVIGKRILLICYLIIFLWLAAFSLYLITNLIRSQLLDENYVWLIMVILLGFGAYGTIRGIEGRARIFEVLFWFLAVPLIIILCLALRDVNVDYWTPIASSDLSGFLLGTYISFASFLAVSLMVFLQPHCVEPKKLARQAKISVLSVGVVNLFIYLILVGIFQVKALATLRRPIVTLMTMVNLPGGFLERQDAFMTAIWFFSLFAFFNTMFYYARTGCEELWKEKKLGYRYLWLVLPALFAGFVWFVQAPGAEQTFYRILLLVLVPFVVLVPFFIYGISGLRGRAGRKGSRKAGALLGILLLCLFCSGCGTKELEDRAFPLAIGIGGTKEKAKVVFAYPDVTGPDAKEDALTKDTIWQSEAESFYDAQNQFERESNMVVDYNHMKALLISRSYASDEEQLTAMMQLFANSEELPRNTLLFLTGDEVDQVISEDTDLKKCLGIYLEQVVDSSMELRRNEPVTLGTLMNQVENQNETILAPILSMEEKKPVITDYQVFDGVKMSGKISSEDALFAFFVNNGIKNASWETKEGKVFELSGIRSNRTLEQSSGGWLLQVHLSVQANLMNGLPQTTQEKADMKETLEQEITDGLLTFLQENKEAGMDLTNSYLQLPGLCRAGWEQVKPDKASYEKNLNYEIDVDVHILNEDF